MSQHVKGDIEKFSFCRLHPQVRLGTASDRYAGWLGQIYSEERYQGRIRQRTEGVGGKSAISTFYLEDKCQ